MPGSHDEEIDWENLTNQELYDKFQQMMSQQVQGFLTTFGEAMEKLDGMEQKFDTKMNAAQLLLLLLLRFLRLSSMMIMMMITMVITMLRESMLQFSTGNNNHHHDKPPVVHMDTTATVGMHHTLRYGITTISLKLN